MLSCGIGRQFARTLEALETKHEQDKTALRVR
jgi:hypothetical protein